MASQTNHFDSDWVARRYGEARPDVHAKIAEHLRSVLGGTPPRRALDLASGTGLSAVAIADLAGRVVAADASLRMLRVARHHPAVRTVAARAESLPFAEACFDLASIGCGFHWCDPERLFAEVARVLRPGSPFVVYDNGFFGEMREAPEAKEWFRSTYRERFPAPPRRPAFRPENAPPGLFRHERTDFLDEWIPFRLRELVRYLTTQTNVIAPVASGRVCLEEVEAFLEASLAPLFEAGASASAHFRFGGLVSVLRRCS